MIENARSRPMPKTVKLGFTRVHGGTRVMWFKRRDRPSADFVARLEQIGAAPIAVQTAKGEAPTDPGQLEKGTGGSSPV